MFSFSIVKKDPNSKARVGVISTPHGDVQTPSYVNVATKGFIRAVTNEQAKRAGVQALISNTYHLWQDKLDEIEKAGGLHTYFKWGNTPMMTDSGGFQVFSFGFGREHNISKVGILPKDVRFRRQVERTFEKEKNAVTITDTGVRFVDGDKKLFLSPQRSIEIQEKLGADIMFAFDECTSPFHDYEYNKQALARTHAWAKICLEAKKRNDQALFGVVQGSIYQDLREESARFLNSLPFAGFGIGGSFGENEMGQVIDWVTDILDEQKPRHLLGIGEISNVLDAIGRGVDTFDCVIPTREGRHGSIWTHDGRYDVRYKKYAADEPLEKGCECEACTTVTRKQLMEMFDAKDAQAGTWASIHNIYFFNLLMKEARAAIYERKFGEFKDAFLARLGKKASGNA